MNLFGRNSRSPKSSISNNERPPALKKEAPSSVPPLLATVGPTQLRSVIRSSQSPKQSPRAPSITRFENPLLAEGRFEYIYEQGESTYTPPRSSSTSSRDTFLSSPWTSSMSSGNSLSSTTMASRMVSEAGTSYWTTTQTIAGTDIPEQSETELRSASAPVTQKSPSILIAQPSYVFDFEESLFSLSPSSYDSAFDFREPLASPTFKFISTPIKSSFSRRGSTSSLSSPLEKVTRPSWANNVDLDEEREQKRRGSWELSLPSPTYNWRGERRRSAEGLALFDIELLDTQVPPAPPIDITSTTRLTRSAKLYLPAGESNTSQTTRRRTTPEPLSIKPHSLTFSTSVARPTIKSSSSAPILSSTSPISPRFARSAPRVLVLKPKSGSVEKPKMRSLNLPLRDPSGLKALNRDVANGRKLRLEVVEEHSGGLWVDDL